MNTKNKAHKALLRAINIADGQAALARGIEGVSGQSTVGNWVMRGKGAPEEYCAQIEMLTGVSRRDLCPDKWCRVWPELVTKDHPCTQQVKTKET